MLDGGESDYLKKDPSVVNMIEQTRNSQYYRERKTKILQDMVELKALQAMHKSRTDAATALVMGNSLEMSTSMYSRHSRQHSNGSIDRPSLGGGGARASAVKRASIL